MSKHTPGPWRINGNNMFRWIVADSEVFTHSGDVNRSAYGGNMVCESVHKANARLIAAAPELLEALKEIVDAADGAGWEQLDPSFKKARAAIAKATGEPA